MAKIKEIWQDIEVLDSIYIPKLKKTYPVFEKTDTPIKALKLHDRTHKTNPNWVITENFSYDIELIKG